MVGALLEMFLHPSYTATVNGQSGVILYLMPHMIKYVLTLTYSMALLHSLVDGLRVRNRCHQKEDLTIGTGTLKTNWHGSYSQSNFWCKASNLSYLFQKCLRCHLRLINYKRSSMWKVHSTPGISLSTQQNFIHNLRFHVYITIFINSRLWKVSK